MWVWIQGFPLRKILYRLSTEVAANKRFRKNISIYNASEEGKLFFITAFLSDVSDSLCRQNLFWQLWNVSEITLALIYVHFNDCSRICAIELKRSITYTEHYHNYYICLFCVSGTIVWKLVGNFYFILILFSARGRTSS